MSTSATLIAIRLRIFQLHNNGMQITRELFKIAKELAKTSQQTRIHPIQTTSVCKTVQYISVLFFKNFAYIRMN